MAEWPPGGWGWQPPAPTTSLRADPPSPRFLPPPYPPPPFHYHQHSTCTYPPPLQQPHYTSQEPSPTTPSLPPFPPPPAGVQPQHYVSPTPSPPVALPRPDPQHSVASAIESARWLQSAFSSFSSTQPRPSVFRMEQPVHRNSIPPYPATSAGLSSTAGPASSSPAGGNFRALPSGLTAYTEPREEENNEDATDIKPFIHKLFAMLSDPVAYSDVITWSSDGTAFFVAHNDRFLNEVLPRMFQHKNITSFTRQLNVYDFHRMNIAQLRSALKNPAVSSADYSGWSHRLFQRGDASNLHLLTPRQSRARLMKKLEKQYGKRKSMEE